MFALRGVNRTFATFRTNVIRKPLGGYYHSLVNDASMICCDKSELASLNDFRADQVNKYADNTKERYGKVMTPSCSFFAGHTSDLGINVSNEELYDVKNVTANVKRLDLLARLVNEITVVYMGKKSLFENPDGTKIPQGSGSGKPPGDATASKTIPDRLKKHTFIHFKGNTGGLLPEEEGMKKNCIKTLVDLLTKKAPACLTWDGDAIKPDSFTELIPIIAQQYASIAKSPLELLVFRQESKFPKFQTTWQAANLGLDVTAVLVRDDVDWRQLGQLAIQTTKGQHVVCYGGGTTLMGEYELYGKGQEWIVYLVGRFNEKNEKEECAMSCWSGKPPKGMLLIHSLK